MVKKILALVIVVMLASSACYAENVFDVLSSIVKSTTSGVKKVVTGFNPQKIVSDTAENTGPATQKMGEATLGGTANMVGVVDQAASSK